MTHSLELTIGGEREERLVISVDGYSYPAASDPDDANWLAATLRIAVGGFRGKCDCTLTTGDFVGFADRLRQLQSEPTASAEFGTIEDQIGFVLRGNRRGSITIHGHVYDQPGIGNRLEWTLEADQTFLPAMIAAAEAIAARWPARGVQGG